MNKLKLSIIIALLMPMVVIANSHQGYGGNTYPDPNVTPTTVVPGETITVDFSYTVTIDQTSFNGAPYSLWEVRLDADYKRSEGGVFIPPLASDEPEYEVPGTTTFYVNVDVNIPEDTEEGLHTIYLYSCPWAYQSAWNGAWYLIPIPINVENPVQEVDIDIKPGSYPNAINLGSNGVVPVAILSEDGIFDATMVDPETVTLAGAGVAVRGKGSKYLAHIDDVNNDGLLDLVCQVETENLEEGEFQDGYAILAGSTYDGQGITGMDEITIVPPE